MGVPGREAGATGDPDAVDAGGIHRSVLHERELAGSRVLVEGEDGELRGQLAVHVAAGGVRGAVFELHHGEERIALVAVGRRTVETDEPMPSGASEKNCGLTAFVDEGSKIGFMSIS
jgi:hypothetical protein